MLVVVALGMAGCARPPAVRADPARLARADAELLQGCYDCLVAARTDYRALAAGANRPVLLSRVFEADLLLALREKELDLPASDAIAEARRIAAELPLELEAARYVALVDAISGDPPGESRNEVLASAAAHALSPDERAELRTWLSRSLLRPPIRDYLRLALDCAYPVTGGVRPPEAARGASPLLAYRAAICELGLVSALSAVRDREPRFIETSYFIANIELATAMLDGPGHAGEHLAEALARFPASPAITYLSGAHDLLVEDYPEALRRFDRALALLPAHDRALLGRIICLTNLGRHQDAIAAATRLLRINEDSRGDAYYWRARNHRALHQLADARRDIAAARAVAATADILSLAGFIEYEQADLDPAQADLTAAIGMASDCTARWYLALVHHQRKRWLAAGQAFDDARACYRDRAGDTATRLQALQARADLDPAYRERAAAGLQGSIDADRKQQHLAELMAASHLVAGGDLVAARPLVDLAAEDPALADQVTKLRTRLDATPHAP